VLVPRVPARVKVDELLGQERALLNVTEGKLIIVLDDNPLVLNGMGGLLRSWGCHVITGDSVDAALTRVLNEDRPPDLIISDYRLLDGKTGPEAIELLRDAFRTPISAFLLSGDTSPELLREAQIKGCHLLHKPVAPMTLRAMLNQILKKGEFCPARQ
jgi:CheY-like chemotaxis protein